MEIREYIRYILSHPFIKSGLRLGAFLAAGVPSFLMAVPLNWVLVMQLGWNKSVAYALVLFVQVSINFFMCRWFVFTERKKNSIWMQFGQFLAGILFFRLADWLLYSLLVSVLGVYFLVAQIANIFIFAIMKYKFSKKVIEAKREG